MRNLSTLWQVGLALPEPVTHRVRKRVFRGTRAPKRCRHSPWYSVVRVAATATVIDVDELRSDLDVAVAQDLRNPGDFYGAEPFVEVDGVHGRPNDPLNVT